MSWGTHGAQAALLEARGVNAPGAKIVFGELTTSAATDTIATGLAQVHICGAMLDDDPVAGCQEITAQKSATAGSIVVKGWKATATADTAMIAATTFSKKVNWWAIGR